MKKVISLLLAFIWVSPIWSQIGVRIKYNNNANFDGISSNVGNFFYDTKLYDHGYELGLDYWLRLKDYRIEFLPEIYGAYSSTAIADTENDVATMLRVGFNFNTHFYVLDFKEDCDCPTFSKEGPGINKGFFLHLSPGIMYETLQMDISGQSANEANYLHFKLGGGVGLDLGISDFLTITPIYTLNFVTGGDWVFDTFSNGARPLFTENTSGIFHQFALRAGFRMVR